MATHSLSLWERAGVRGLQRDNTRQVFFSEACAPEKKKTVLAETD
jgi:hypothetical protein